MKQCNLCNRYFPDSTITCPDCQRTLAMVNTVPSYAGVGGTVNRMLISSPVLSINRTRPESVGHEQVIYRRPRNRRVRRNVTETPVTQRTATPQETAQTLAPTTHERRQREGISTISKRRDAIENRVVPDRTVNNQPNSNTASDHQNLTGQAAAYVEQIRRNAPPTRTNETPALRVERARAANSANTDEIPTRRNSRRVVSESMENLPSFRTENRVQNSTPSPLFSALSNTARSRRRPLGHPVRNALLSNLETIIRFLIPLALIGGAIYLIVMNWEAIKAIAAVFAVFWIIGFGLTLVFSHRFFHIQADTLIALSTIMAVILILIYYNVAGIGSGIAALLSSFVPIILTVAAICYMIRLIFR